MKRFLKILRRVLCVLLTLVLLVIAGTGVWNVLALRSFYQTAVPEFTMPGIEDRRFDEQGIDYDDGTGLFFFTGYMRDGTANPVCLVDAQNGNTVKTVRLLNADGSAFCGHAGGIAVTDDYVYIAGSADCCLYVYRKADILQAENEACVTCAGVFPTALSSDDGVKVSFVTRAGDKIYVGEFHLPLVSAYQLRDNHRLSTRNGNNAALMIGFQLEEAAPLGLASVPCAAYSLPDLVQGVCFSGEDIILSESFGLMPSVIACTKAVPEGSFTVMQTEVPLYSLQESSRTYVPPMSEEIDLYSGRLYIASELYNYMLKGFGSIWRSEYCWSIQPADRQR